MGVRSHEHHRQAPAPWGHADTLGVIGVIAFPLVAAPILSLTGYTSILPVTGASGAMALQGAGVGVVIAPAVVMGGSLILAACIVASVVAQTYLAIRRTRRQPLEELREERSKVGLHLNPF